MDIENLRCFLPVSIRGDFPRVWARICREIDISARACLNENEKFCGNSRLGERAMKGIIKVRLLLALSAGLTVFVTAAQAQDVTFTKDVAPILQRSCQNCHRPDSIAPMSLLTYEEVRPWAKAIKERTLLRRGRGAMPPWFIEKEIGIQRFKDDISLTDAELAKIGKWVDSGAPRGN